MDIYRVLQYLPVKRFKEAPPQVAVVRLAGVIGHGGPWRSSLSLANLERTLKQAFDLPRLKAVALAINSPGGSPVQSELIARRLRDLAKEKDVPILAFCEDVAASGGYWLASAADEVFVQPSSIVGSIGVIYAGFGFPDLIARYGIERRLHTSGDRKAMLDPFKPERPEDVERLKEIQKQIHERFVTVVKERRGDKLKEDSGDLFSGEFWTGERAVELGLADAVGELRQILRARFGEKVKIRRMESEKSWLKRRLGLHGAPGLSGPSAGGKLAAGLGADLLSALEERAYWSRYGL